MIPYAIKCGELSHEHLVLYRIVVNALNNMPEKPATGPGLTCHDVCEKLLKDAPALANSLAHVRGKFHYHEHSWLEFKFGRNRVIIDAYPWAASGPIMIAAGTGTPWATLYKEKGGGSGQEEREGTKEA